MTSHFEFQSPDGLRMRTGFCSRPPRVADLERMWKRAVRVKGMDVVDVESLIQLKQTRRVRDYSMVGALAEVAGLDGDAPALALNYLQDCEMLAKAVAKWPKEAAACDREAVRLLVANASRVQIVSAIAVEQDARMQEDQIRIGARQERFDKYARDVARSLLAWRRTGVPLVQQHEQLAGCARRLLEPNP